MSYFETKMNIKNKISALEENVAYDRTCISEYVARLQEATSKQEMNYCDIVAILEDIRYQLEEHNNSLEKIALLKQL